MILLDVNVLIYAHRAELPQHAAGSAFLTDLLEGDDGFAVPLVTDAWIAALAIEHGCELATSDGDFKRFAPRLIVRDYL